MAVLRFAPLFVFFLAAVMLAMLLLGERQTGLTSALVGHAAPQLPDALRGKTVVVNFFASWCAPCRAEQPALMDISARTDIVLYGIAYKDAPEDTQIFLDTFGNPFAKVTADRQGARAIDWGTTGVPETFIVDKQGIVRFHHAGPLTQKIYKNTLLPAIEELM